VQSNVTSCVPVVPGHSGRDWAAEIDNGVIRMNEDTQQSHENNDNRGGSVFPSGRKWALGAKKGIETFLCQRITGTDWKKVLANRWNRKRITKRVSVGRGQEIKWEILEKIENLQICGAWGKSL
jgi:hypothetical protein